MEYTWRPGIEVKYVCTKRSSSPQMVDMAPGGRGGTMATTPFSSGPRSSPVLSLTMRASNP
ncbi:Uncharacterised protein [Bordetella pertussis]|nr:Uncharacterised protein [Bordetella pertussis]CFW37655.1 Uncharacterised protein [Bordetella pertussis]CPN97992.1 Uncharacterised protein [Bordetella pertussis]